MVVGSGSMAMRMGITPANLLGIYTPLHN